jgi:peptidoglycan/LPS O-acetylase OafA/YrhL
MTGYLPTLDGWRAVALFMVLISHSIAIPGTHWKAHYSLGLYGVEVFFGISGYLICTRLLWDHQARGHIDITAFYIRRIFRIFPCAWCYLAAIGIMTSFGIALIDWDEALACLFFYRNYFTAHGWFTAHFWSLAVEEHFYLFLPLFLVVCGRNKALFTLPILAILGLLWRWLDSTYQLTSGLTADVFPMFRTDFRVEGPVGLLGSSACQPLSFLDCSPASSGGALGLAHYPCCSFCPRRRPWHPCISHSLGPSQHSLVPTEPHRLRAGAVATEVGRAPEL